METYRLKVKVLNHILMEYDSLTAVTGLGKLER